MSDNQLILSEQSSEVPMNSQTPMNVSGDMVAKATVNYPKEQRELIDWIFGYAKVNKWAMTDLERHCKISRTVLYRVFTGKYKNNVGEPISLDSVCERIDVFKKLAEARDLLGKLPFVETSVFKQIEKLYKIVLESHDIGLVFGESQVGKTASFLELKRRHNHGLISYVLAPAAGGAQGLLKAIAASCHISPNTCFDSLRGRVVNFLNDSKVMIVDEVHEIFHYQKPAIVKCFGLLRQIQETTQCGMILSGTNEARKEFEQGEFAYSLKQILKRGIWDIQLDPVTSPADIALIAAHYRLGKPDTDTARVIDTVNKEFGLGKFTKYLAKAHGIAKARGHKFAWAHFVEIVEISESMRLTSEEKAKARERARQDARITPLN